MVKGLDYFLSPRSEFSVVASLYMYIHSCYIILKYPNLNYKKHSLLTFTFQGIIRSKRFFSLTDLETGGQ